MKIQLDTTSKTIKIEENVLLSKLIDTLNGLLPNKEWKKYTLETNTVIEHWHSPTIIREIAREPYVYPWWRPTYYAANMSKTIGNNDYSLKSGIFNVELKA